MMANILKNPTLSGFTTVTYFTNNSGNTGAIEYPDDWEYIYTPLHEEDPNLIPQSLHRDRGFVITGGWSRWEAGYVQRGIRLRGGQRYLCKAVFVPDVNFASGQPEDLTVIQWRFWLRGEGEEVSTEWRVTGKGAYKQEEETLLVVEARRDIAVDFTFKARSIWASNACDFKVYQLSLEEVSADYGGADVAYIGGETEVSPVAPVEGTSPPETPPVETGSRSLGDVLSDDDITVIAEGLREMRDITANPVVLAAFERLADALERLKNSG